VIALPGQQYDQLGELPYVKQQRSHNSAVWVRLRALVASALVSLLLACWPVHAQDMRWLSNVDLQTDVSEGFSLGDPKLLASSDPVGGGLELHHEVAERDVQQVSSETVAGYDMVSDGFSLGAARVSASNDTVRGDHEVAERDVQKASSEIAARHDMPLAPNFLKRFGNDAECCSAGKSSCCHSSAGCFSCCQGDSVGLGCIRVKDDRQRLLPSSGDSRKVQRPMRNFGRWHTSFTKPTSTKPTSTSRRWKHAMSRLVRKRPGRSHASLPMPIRIPRNTE